MLKSAIRAALGATLLQVAFASLLIAQTPETRYSGECSRTVDDYCMVITLDGTGYFKAMIRAGEFTIHWWAVQGLTSDYVDIGAGERMVDVGVSGFIGNAGFIPGPAYGGQYASPEIFARPMGFGNDQGFAYVYSDPWTFIDGGPAFIGGCDYATIPNPNQQGVLYTCGANSWVVFEGQTGIAGLRFEDPLASQFGLLAFPAPEPSTLTMMALGIVALAGTGTRRRKPGDATLGTKLPRSK